MKIPHINTAAVHLCMCDVANFLLSLAVKEFLKLPDICLSYERM